MRFSWAGVAIVIGSTATTVRADDVPDFFFDLSSCQVQATSLDSATAELKVKKETTYAMTCFRQPKSKVACTITFDELNTKPAKLVGTLKELGALVVIEGSNGADFMMARRDSGVVTATTRIGGESFLASKLCRGRWMTGDEIRAMKRSKTSAP